MEIKLLHLYPDCMSLYGEYANVALLKKKLELLGATVTVDRCPLDDAPDFTTPHFIYMGCGTERTQKAALMALKDRGGALKAALDRGAVILFTGNAMEALGRTVTDRDGHAWPGMGLAEFTTQETDRREPEDVIALTPLLDEPVVGFMNKCSRTAGVTVPLFDRLKLGPGNEAELESEGWVEGNLFATHITGPVLVKNPHLLDLVAGRVLAAAGGAAPAVMPAIPHQREAYDVTLAELSRRVKEETK